MAFSCVHNVLVELVLLLLIDGAFGVITTAPKNQLFVGGDDTFANMTCVSNATDEIAWTYDGTTVINAPCTSVAAFTDVFVADRISENECAIGASRDRAMSTATMSISGVYGCIDQSNFGVTETAMVIVVDGWCGVLSNATIDGMLNVDIGCNVQYDWLSHQLQYQPLVSVNVSVELVGVSGTLTVESPSIPSSPPPTEDLQVTYTMRDVKPGQRISQTCRVTFEFQKRSGSSSMNRYATNSLEWICNVDETMGPEVEEAGGITAMLVIIIVTVVVGGVLIISVISCVLIIVFRASIFKSLAGAPSAAAGGPIVSARPANCQKCQQTDRMPMSAPTPAHRAQSHCYYYNNPGYSSPPSCPTSDNLCGLPQQQGFNRRTNVIVSTPTRPSACYVNCGHHQ